MRSTVSPRRSTLVLYAGLAVFLTLTAFTARAMWVAWQDRSGQARADAIFALVDERTPLRPTDTPGATAWLQFELDRYGRQIATPDRAARFRAFATSGDVVPEDLRPILSALRDSAAAEPITSPLTVVHQGGAPGARRRDEFVLHHGDRALVMTRRRDSQSPAPSRDPLVRSAVSVLEKNADSAMSRNSRPTSQKTGMSCKSVQPQCRPSMFSSTNLLPK